MKVKVETVLLSKKDDRIANNVHSDQSLCFVVSDQDQHSLLSPVSSGARGKYIIVFGSRGDFPSQVGKWEHFVP